MFSDWRKWCRLCGKNNGTEVDIFFKLETVSGLSESVQKFFHISVSVFFFVPTYFSIVDIFFCHPIKKNYICLIPIYLFI